MSDFVIVGKTGACKYWDILRTDMIRNTSECKEFLFSQFDSSLVFWEAPLLLEQLPRLLLPERQSR